MRDLLYCLHDASYFEGDDDLNETLTTSMINAWPKSEPTPSERHLNEERRFESGFGDEPIVKDLPHHCEP